MKNREVQKRNVYRICLCAMFVAVYTVLSTLLTIRTPFAEFSWSSLPILLCAFLMGPIETVTVALCGSFLEQIFVGLNAQAPLWMMPVVLLALVAGMGAYLIREDENAWKMIAVIVVSEVVLTLANSVLLYATGWLLTDISSPVLAVIYTLVSTPKLGIRLTLSVIGVPLIVPPLRKAMRRAKL